MRLFLLENFVDHEFDITNKEGKEELIAFAKKHCAKAINEFYRPNKYLFRGISGISGDAAYIIPTKQKRTPFGTSTKGKTGASFNQWLEDNGHVRRDKNVAFATSSMPEEYRGIHNDEWFFFLPIDDYHYSYINTVQGGDFNYHSWVQKSLGSLYTFEDMIDDLESKVNYSRHNLSSLQNKNPNIDFKNLPDVMDLINGLDEINQQVGKLIVDVAMLYQEGVFQDNNLEKLYKNMIKIPEFDDVYTKLFLKVSDVVRKANDGSNSDLDWLMNTSTFLNSFEAPREEVNAITRLVDPDETIKISKALMQSFATDEITPHFEDNEIAVQCELYLVIPYSIGFEFLDKLVY